MNGQGQDIALSEYSCTDAARYTFAVYGHVETVVVGLSARITVAYLQMCVAAVIEQDVYPVAAGVSF